MKTPILAALALVLGTFAAAAQCTDHIRFSCPEGQQWDDTAKSCVAPSS